jgi:hypothetical protein
VGRTGAFIVIDSMLERMKHEKTVDVYGHVTCLRAQRNYMVQTEDQYIFIHDALLEAALSGSTEVSSSSTVTCSYFVVDPHHLDADPDSDFFLCGSRSPKMMRIQIHNTTR